MMKTLQLSPKSICLFKRARNDTFTDALYDGCKTDITLSKLIGRKIYEG